MICPNCQNQTSGQWCRNCGFKLPDESASRNSGNYSGFPNDSGNYPDERKYSDEYDRMSEPENAGKKSGSKKTAIIVCSIVAVLIIAAVAFIAFKGLPEKEAENIETVASSENDPDEKEIRKLRKRADNYLEAADYETAEKTYKQIHEMDSDDDEAFTLYTILFNYNRAVKALDEKNYTQARKNMDKIPGEYEQYDTIRADVEYLDSELTKGEAAYKAFEALEDLIGQGEYEDASNKIEQIDEEFLTDDDCKKLDKYRDEIDDNLSVEIDEPDEYDDYDYYSGLSEESAQILVNSYCSSLVSAINSRDFSIVEPYIYSGSTLYNQQKNLIDYYEEINLTQTFVGVDVNYVTEVNSTTWDVNVTEQETIYYSSGSYETQSYNWTYTIEYIGSEFYFTKIR